MVIIFRKVEVKTDMNRFWRYFSNLKLSPGSIQGVWARSRLSWMGSLPCHERSCSNLPIHHHRHQDWFTIITVIIVIIPTIHFYHQMTIVIIATNTLQSSDHGWDHPSAISFFRVHTILHNILGFDTIITRYLRYFSFGKICA